MKRIIVEGMDSTGKSTLIEKLHSEFHQLETIVNAMGPSQNFDSWWMHELTRDHGPFVPLHDRFFYSELVYGYHLRGYIKATQRTQNEVSAILRRDALLIFCRPDTHTVIQTLTNKPQMEGVVPRTHRLLQAYDELMWQEQKYYMDRFVHFDWTRDWEKPTEKVIKVVEAYLEND